MTAQQSFYSHIDCKLAQADKQRNKSVYQTVGGSYITTTRYYAGSYEKEIMGNNSVKEYDYIYTPEGLGAIVTKTGGSYSISYVHTDHLGSPRVISNGAKAVLARYSYDAWGKRTLVAGTNITNRGFTGHEHIDNFGLINMNARLYDPTSGRFISLDPYVQAPDFSQSFNRYSYALNNPLSFTDPTGEIAWLIPIIIGAVIGGASGAMIGHANEAKGWDMVGYIAGGALIGGLSGGAASGVSALGGAAWWAGAAAGAVGGAGFSGLATGWDAQAMLKGAAFGAISGFVGGGLGSAIGGGWGAFTGGAAGSGLNTALNGGDWTQVGISALAGGLLSYGTYELTSYIGWKNGGSNIAGNKVKYSAYKVMNAQIQRSMFWHRENGGYLLKDGSYLPVDKQFTSKYYVDFDGASKTLTQTQSNNVATRVHTHWTFDKTYYYNMSGDKITQTHADLIDALGGTYTKKQTYLNFSPNDLASYGNNLLLNRVGGAYYLNTGYSRNTAILSDIFFRFFLFPYIP